MAISHQSIIHKPLDYVAPVDLNLLGKVLQFKQAKFDQGVSKVQSHFDTLASLDMVKGSDKEYLNAKLNNLVAATNNIGGADFSDVNTTNQIAGLSSQIYGDENVINAVNNTKKFRYVQGFYQNLKEKKPKDYNPANEWFDMSKFSSWLSDGAVGSSPVEGAGSVNPYVDYTKDWQDLFNKMKTNMRTEITDKGLVYRIDTHEYTSEAQIWDAAAKLLTPAQKKQIAIEGRYTYQDAPVSELLRAYDENTYNKIGQIKDQIDDYKAKLKGATSAVDQDKYIDLIAKREAEVETLLQPVERNAEQIKEKLYLNEKLSGLASRYAVTRSSTKLQAATDKMFQMKYNLDVAQFQHRQIKDGIDQQISIADKGLMWVKDQFGNATLIADPNSPARSSNKKGTPQVPFGTVTVNSPEGAKDDFAKEQLDVRKTDLVTAKDKLFTDFIKALGADKGYEFDDMFINDLKDDGNIQMKVDPAMAKAANEIMVAWKAMANGDKVNYEKIPYQFRNFIPQYQEVQKEIESIDAYYGKISDQVAEEYQITTAEKNIVKTYNKLQKQLSDLELKYPRGGAAVAVSPSFGGASGINNYRQNNSAYLREKAEIESQIADLQPLMNTKKIKTYDKEKDQKALELIKSGSVRYNTIGVIQHDDDDKTVAKMAGSAAGQAQWYNEDGSVGAKQTLAHSNIVPVYKAYEYLKTPDGYKRLPVLTFHYKTGTTSEDYEIRKVPLDDNQAKQLGFGESVKPMSGYDFGLNTVGKVRDVITSQGKNYQLTFDIVKYNPEDPNDPRVFAIIKKPNGTTISTRPTPAANYKELIGLLEGKPLQMESQEKAFEFLEDARNQIINQ